MKRHSSIAIFIFLLLISPSIKTIVPESPGTDYERGKAYSIASSVATKFVIPALVGFFALPTLSWLTSPKTNLLNQYLYTWTIESNTVIRSHKKVSKKEDLDKMLEYIRDLTATCAQIYGLENTSFFITPTISK